MNPFVSAYMLHIDDVRLSEYSNEFIREFIFHLPDSDPELIMSDMKQARATLASVYQKFIETRTALEFARGKAKMEASKLSEYIKNNWTPEQIEFAERFIVDAQSGCSQTSEDAQMKTCNTCKHMEQITNWQPIETAPRNGKRMLYLAKFRGDELVEIDFDGSWEYWSESWEMSHINGWCWESANGIEEPTHWAYQDQPLPPAVATYNTDTHEIVPKGMREAVELVTAIAHFGGLAGLNENEALRFIRHATLPYFDRSASDEQNRAALQRALDGEKT